jgi:hypothetical protein
MWTETVRQYGREGLRYASDVTDENWVLIEGALPPATTLGRPRTTEPVEAAPCFRRFDFRAPAEQLRGAVTQLGTDR